MNERLILQFLKNTKMIYVQIKFLQIVKNIVVWKFPNPKIPVPKKVLLKAIQRVKNKYIHDEHTYFS